MSANYNSSLPADTDWVRFLIPDTDITSPLFQDEEIAAQISEETSTGQAKKYYVAAALLGLLAVRLADAGQGVESIRIGSLSITQGVSTSSASIIEARMKWLQVQGQYYQSLESGTSGVAQILGSRCRLPRGGYY